MRGGPRPRPESWTDAATREAVETTLRWSWPAAILLTAFDAWVHVPSRHVGLLVLDVFAIACVAALHASRLARGFPHATAWAYLTFVFAFIVAFARVEGTNPDVVLLYTAFAVVMPGVVFVRARDTTAAILLSAAAVGLALWPLALEEARFVVPGYLVGAILWWTRHRHRLRLETAIIEERAAKQHLAGLLRAAPVGVFLVDLSAGKFLEANEAACRLLGRPRDALVQLGPPDIVHPDDRAASRAAIEDLRTGRRSLVEGERRFVRGDGTTMLVAIRSAATTGADGRPAVAFAVFEDITARRAAETALRASEERFRELAENIRDVFWIAAPDLSRILFVSPAFEAVFGTRPEDVAAQWWSMVHPEDKPLVASQMELARKGGYVSTRYRIIRPDGQVRSLHDRAFPVCAPDGSVARLVGVAEDVTEHVAAESALRRTERDAALGALVAGVAHEINNPLQFMEGNLELSDELLLGIAADARTPEDLAKAAGDARQHELTVRKGIEQIARITQSLRRVARRSAGPRAAERIDGVVEGVLDMTRPRFGPDIELVLELAATKRSVMDVGEVSQVVLNLLLNAAEALGDRGHVSIRTRDAPGGVVLEVEDDGPGIPVLDQPRIFTPFFTTKQAGTGLGLSVSRRIVEDHGGHLTFESRPGRTVFRVQLPEAPAVAITT